MLKILVFQSRVQKERLERERQNMTNAIGGRAQIEFLSAVDERLAWAAPEHFLRGVDGVIFGGSSDFDFHGGREEGDPMRVISMMIRSRLRNEILHAFTDGIPVMGICFGHQIIAGMHGGDIDNDHAQSKFGAFEVTLTEEGRRDPIFSALPPVFAAEYAHKDSATRLPEGAVLLGSAPNCTYSILRYGKNAYTTQFHPEIRETAGKNGPGRDISDAYRIIPLWIEKVVIPSKSP